jgi:hypothetical protein
MRLRLLALITCLVVISAGCAGNRSPASATFSVGTAANDTPTAVNPTPSSPAPTAVNPTPSFPTPTSTEAELDGALLTAADVPGWSSNVIEEPLITDKFCNVDIEPAGAIARRRALIANRATGEGIFESISFYAPDAAAVAVAAARNAVSSCASWNKPTPTGSLAIYTPSTLEFTSLGDETVAAAVSIVAPARMNGEDHVVVVRRGALVMVLSYLTPGSGDPARTANLVQPADQKLTTLASILQ